MNNRIDYPVIDFHAHIFPDKIAEKAVESIGQYYHLQMNGKGTAGDLIREGSVIGVKRYVIHSTATRPEQVKSINDFIAWTCGRHGELIGFGTLHRDQTDLAAEFERILSLGLKGIKLHPEFQNFAIDEPAMMPLYETIGGRLPILMHMGDENKDTSSPERLSRVLDRYPDLTVIAAHLGGYRMWRQSLDILAGRNVYFDTSSSLAFLTPEEAAAIIRKHGITKVLFGTDYPMWLHRDELDRFLKLDLTKEERERILWKNGAELLNEIRA